MDQRVAIVSKELSKDVTYLRVRASFQKLDHYNYYKKIITEEFGRNEVDDFQGPGELFLTNLHFIFFTDKRYRYVHPRNERMVLFERPYMCFHRICLGRVDFELEQIRIDEVIHNHNGPENFYGKYTFSILNNFQDLAFNLGIQYSPEIPVYEFDVVPRFQSYYTSVYPMEDEHPLSCPRCRFYLIYVEHYRRYWCERCRGYI
jgi:hypothetical protein